MTNYLDYDAELRLHNEVLRAAYGIRRADNVLDIGCGTGETTREAARMALDGSVLGVDVSAPMIERARELSQAEGLQNVLFEVADAQVHTLRPDYFDIAISRFGTMFFADAVAAFGNIGRALRPGGRLVMMVWQDGNSNEWFVSIRTALAGGEKTASLPEDVEPFSLGDPSTVEEILAAAGFTEVAFSEVDKPVYYGRDVGAAFDFARALWITNEMVEHMDRASSERALERLRRTLAEHQREDGVWFESRAWIVTARRR
jgi:ubiquinone/menaquinone biosynthesis C-methylase UbiE